MAVYRCCECDRFKDNDYVVCYEKGSELMCEDCAIETEHADYMDVEQNQHPFEYTTWSQVVRRG